MARRIRTLKPEVLEDERTADLSDMAFRLFVSVILMADDHGKFRADLRYLQSQIYWTRDVDRGAFARAWNELSWVIDTYSVGGQTYAQILTWTKHQRVEKPSRSVIPDKIGQCNDNSGNIHRSLPEASPNIHRSLPEHSPTDLGSGSGSGILDLGPSEARGRADAGGERVAAGASEHTHNLPDCSREDESGTRFDASPRPTQPDESKRVLKAITAETKTAEQKPSQIPARAELQPQRISDTAPAEPGDPPPTWWDDVLALVSVQIGIDLPRVESWIRYAGHRASKARPAERRDAAHWVTSVLVAEHRRDRERRHRETRAPDIPANETELRDLETRFPMRRRAKP